MARNLFSSLFCLVTLSAACYGSTVYQANPIFGGNLDPIFFQDNFDSYSTGTYNNPSTPGPNWTVNGSIDVVGGAFFGGLVVGDESGNAIDLNGSSQGGLTSLAIFLAPGTYTLTFDLNGSQRGIATSTTVTLGSFVNSTINQNSADLGTGITYNFTVLTGTSANLVFASNTPGAVGSLLDNVVLSGTLSTPEPSTFGLMLGAIPILWAVRKRYTRK